MEYRLYVWTLDELSLLERLLHNGLRDHLMFPYFVMNKRCPSSRKVQKLQTHKTTYWILWICCEQINSASSAEDP